MKFPYLKFTLNKLLAILLAILATLSVDVVGEEIDPRFADLHARLEFASDPTFETARVSGEERLLTRERREPAVDAAQKVLDFKRQLRSDIESGKVSIGSQEIELMRNEFGTDKLEEILTIPRARGMVDQHISSRAEEYRIRITSPRTTHDFKQKGLWIVDQARGGRAEREFTEVRINDVVQEGFVGRTDVEVVNGAYSKLRADRIEYGRILHGLNDEPSRFAQITGTPSITLAGRPVVRGVWEASQVRRVEEVTTPEGPALKVWYSQVAGEPLLGATSVMWVLPEQGYSLYRAENFDNGALSSLQEYSQFVNTDAGTPYPKAQKTQIFNSTPLPKLVSDGYATGELSLGDPNVEMLQERDVYMLTERAVSKIETDIQVEDSLFELEFPANTLIQDFRVIDGGHPLTYRLGLDQSISE